MIGEIFYAIPPNFEGGNVAFLRFLAIARNDKSFLTNSDCYFFPTFRTFPTFDSPPIYPKDVIDTTKYFAYF